MHRYVRSLQPLSKVYSRRENDWSISYISSTAQGFFVQFGACLPQYNAMLAIYYMLVIHYSVSEERLKEKYEKFMHTIPLAFAVATSIASLPLHLYNEANIWCWIAVHPEGCERSEDGCERGENAFIYRWAFYYGPLWLSAIIVLGCLYQVYLGVKTKEDKIASFDPSKKKRTQYRTSGTERPAKSGNQEGSTDNGPSPAGSKSKWRRSLASIDLSRFSRRSLVKNSGPRTRQVASQALAYVLAFYLTHFFGTVNRVIQQSTGGVFYEIALLQSIFQVSLIMVN